MYNPLSGSRGGGSVGASFGVPGSNGVGQFGTQTGGEAEYVNPAYPEGQAAHAALATAGAYAGPVAMDAGEPDAKRRMTDAHRAHAMAVAQMGPQAVFPPPAAAAVGYGSTHWAWPTAAHAPPPPIDPRPAIRHSMANGAVGEFPLASWPSPMSLSFSPAGSGPSPSSTLRTRSTGPGSGDNSAAALLMGLSGGAAIGGAGGVPASAVFSSVAAAAACGGLPAGFYPAASAAPAAMFANSGMFPGMQATYSGAAQFAAYPWMSHQVEAPVPPRWQANPELATAGSQASAATSGLPNIDEVSAVSARAGGGGGGGAAVAGPPPSESPDDIRPVPISRMRLGELRLICRSMKLSDEGTAPQLRARIEEARRSTRGEGPPAASPESSPSDAGSGGSRSAGSRRKVARKGKPKSQKSPSALARIERIAKVGPPQGTSDEAISLHRQQTIMAVQGIRGCPMGIVTDPERQILRKPMNVANHVIASKGRWAGRVFFTDQQGAKQEVKGPWFDTENAARAWSLRKKEEHGLKWTKKTEKGRYGGVGFRIYTSNPEGGWRARMFPFGCGQKESETLVDHIRRETSAVAVADGLSWTMFSVSYAAAVAATQAIRENISKVNGARNHAEASAVVSSIIKEALERKKLRPIPFEFPTE